MKLLEMHQKSNGHFLKELRVSFNGTGTSFYLGTKIWDQGTNETKQLQIQEEF